MTQALEKLSTNAGTDMTLSQEQRDRLAKALKTKASKVTHPNSYMIAAERIICQLAGEQAIKANFQLHAEIESLRESDLKKTLEIALLTQHLQGKAA